MEPDAQLAPRVLLAVHDDLFRRSTAAGLRAAGFSVSAPTDADAAVMLATSFAPDVIVVESGLAGLDERPLHQTLRGNTDRYVLCIEGRNDEQARVRLLRNGVDDTVSSPVGPDEIAARCHALLRRPRQLHVRWDPVAASMLELGPLTIDLGRREVRVHDEEIPTTRIEFALLEQLCRRPAEVCTRNDLLDAVWGPNWVGDTHVVDVHLSNLRRKLDSAARGLRIIHTVRGVGFRLGNDVLDQIEPALSA